MPISTRIPRRHRIQFSLRTLMIGVLLYGTLWLLTATWGANWLLRKEARAYESAHFKLRDSTTDGRVVISWPGGTPERRASAWSPAPFILISHWDIGSEKLAENWLDYRDTRVWLFGHNVSTRKGREPVPSAFIPEFDEENIGFTLTVTPGLRNFVSDPRIIGNF